jgi:tetratricopeptide (TPR) repeat protein
MTTTDGAPSKGPLLPETSTQHLIEGMHNAVDLDRFLAFTIVDRIAEADPEFADAIRRCAIPRRFDAEILAMVRGDSDKATNKRLFDGIAGLTFVHRRSDLSYSYDDTTRQVLLNDWRTESHRELLNEINARLITYYSERLEAARTLETDLWRVRHLVREANPERYVQLTMMVESANVVPLLEGIYHQVLRSADQGFDAFQQYCFQYESTGQIAICQSLLLATRKYIEDMHPTESSKWSGWFGLWEGRLAVELGLEAKAEGVLKNVLEHAENDSKLTIWTLSELGSALQQQAKLREAAQTFAKELSLREEMPSVDPWNLPTTYANLAGINWTLGNLDEAQRGFEKALELARTDSNAGTEFSAQLNLSVVLGEAGRRDEAVVAALAALHLARTRLRAELARHQAVAEQLAALLATRKPALADTALRTGEELGAAISPGPSHLRQACRYAETLLNSGQLQRGRERLEQIKRDAEGTADPLIASWLLLIEAQFCEGEGDYERAVSLNSSVVQRARDGQAGDWQRAVALHRNANIELRRARWSEAESDARAAGQEWLHIGQDSYAADMHVVLAEIVRRRGDLQLAQKLLDEVKSELEGAQPSLQADLHEARGHACDDAGEWAPAALEYQSALDIHRSLDNHKDAARLLQNLASVANIQGKWQASAELLAEAQTLWRALADLDRYRPSAAAERADKYNARAIRLFAEGNDRAGYKLPLARDLFRQASEIQGRNPWYLLNLSYACATLEEWGEACKALTEAMDGKLEGLPIAFFEERLAEYEAMLRAPNASGQAAGEPTNSMSTDTGPPA